MHGMRPRNRGRRDAAGGRDTATTRLGPSGGETMSRQRIPTRAEAIAALEDLYEQVPAIECKGLCHDSCTSIDASELERERLAARGVTLPVHMSYERLQALIATGKTPRCPALSPLNTCSVYDVRPLICRVFGVVRDRSDLIRGGLRCEHGCIPDATIDASELFRALRQIEELSIAVTGVPRSRRL
ncbi:Putative zinc-or iron-chelating domain-containing protein [Amycolatopsis pretoriensis]|uniref:Putative zinc-or iron-chelating domain-containing protein n=3 Tax=Amycolatopsis pretoriensis TaxID=218821 RepID=A0A1H5R7W0_9PSEU|nr:Putative zinc-or iron-chelating domain-containing protein [Amycolatopsis pretoriensis]